MFKKSMILLLVIAASVIGGTIYGYSTSDNAVKLDAATIKADDKIDSEEKSIFVYVTGAVNKPGMVELAGEQSRIADAVNACGGLLPTADVDNFNMAQIISDGQHIRVPEKIVEREGNVNNVKDNKSKSDGDVVNINQASATELETLPGIGPAMAQRIIDYRTEHGEFKTIEEIQNVRGIGAKKFEKLKSHIKV